MRYGCCLNMLSSAPDGTGAEHIEALAKMGYDYVELPLAEMTALPQNKLREISTSLSNAGLQCETCNNFFPKSVRLTGDDVKTEAVQEYVKRALDNAGRLGVSRLVFGSGGAKRIPEGFSREKGYDQIVQLLKWVAPIASSCGVMITIEPLRKAECNIINTFEEGVTLARDVAEKNVMVLVDFYHLQQENEPMSHLEEWAGSYLRHVHISRPCDRRFPQEIEEDAYREFFGILRRAGYDERISIEAYTENFFVDGRTGLALLRDSIN